MAAANPYRGDVELEVCGQKRILRYSWAEVAKLQARIGKKFQEEIQRAIGEGDVEVLGDVLIIGLEANWPEVMKDEVMKNPPLMAHASTAIANALCLTFYGTSGEAAAEGENPSKAGAPEKAMEKAPEKAPETAGTEATG